MDKVAWLIEKKVNIPEYQWLVTPDIFTNDAFEARWFKYSQEAIHYLNDYMKGEMDKFFVSEHVFTYDDVPIGYFKPTKLGKVSQKVTIKKR